MKEGFCMQHGQLCEWLNTGRDDPPQMASSWQGIRACESLEKQGINCNMTLLFSFAQVRRLTCTHVRAWHRHT